MVATTYKKTQVRHSSFYILLFLLAHLSVEAQNFEGIIHYEIPEMKQQGMGELAYMIKDSNIRMEFGGGMQKGAMLYFPEDSKMVVLIDQMKGYFSIDMDKAETVDEESDRNAPIMQKTGVTKTIAGKSCEVWSIDDKDNHFSVCMAKGLGKFLMPKNPMTRQQVPEWAKEAMGEGTMPLEVLKSNGKDQEIQMRATRIEEKHLDTSLFVIPDDYHDMSGMMQQMMNRNQH